MLERLDWEITTPETPHQVRTRLEGVRRAVSELDWSKQDQFEAARNAWTPVKQWVEQEVNRKRQLREAVDYDLQASQELSEHWNIFLYGKKSLF